MKKNNPLISIFLFFLFLNSCGSVAEGLSGSKKKSSEEFLVEKKAPLVLPPKFGELPEPGVKQNKDSDLKKENKLSIESIIKKNSSNSSSTENKDSNNSFEKSIIEKINEK